MSASSSKTRSSRSTDLRLRDESSRSDVAGDRLQQLLRKRRDSRLRESEDVPELEELEPRVRASLSAKALISNFRSIQAQLPKASMIPMIKANAYGHGAAWAARLLSREPGIAALGVASIEEGHEVRQALSKERRQTPIVVFSGASPFTEQLGRFCERHGLTPVLFSKRDAEAFFKGNWQERIPYQIEFNTGMNRLGLGLDALSWLRSKLSKIEPTHHPHGIFTHFAEADDAESALTRRQVERFQRVRAELASVAPSTWFHCANSAAIWNARKLGLEGIEDFARPGLSLYGATPWKGAPLRGLVPVMTLEARVLQRQVLQPGDSIGYASAFRVPPRATEPVHAATLAAGYADGVLRGLSGETGKRGGSAWVGERSRRFLGRVSMDLLGVECDPGTREGEWVELLGPRIDCWDQAAAAGTIPYELFTSISPRVRRIYTD